MTTNKQKQNSQHLKIAKQMKSTNDFERICRWPTNWLGAIFSLLKIHLPLLQMQQI